MIDCIIIILSIACVALAAKLRMVMLEKAQLKKQNWMKEAFLKTLSHELRTPLHSVCGLAEIIAKDDLYLSKSEKRAIANQILYNVELISTQLDEVLLFAGNGNGHKLQEETLSPNQLCLKCVEANRIKEQLNPNIKLTFRRELSDETFIRTDRHLLEYIINQMVVNAFKYTKEGTVTIGCCSQENPQRIIFYVEDTGCGVPKGREEAMFNWFDEPNENYQDTELEMSIVQKIAMKLGGYLSINPTYTNGTRIEMTMVIS